MEKLTHWTCTKIKNICSGKDPIKMKRQTTDWEKIFSDHISNKELVSRIYKEHSKLNGKNIPNNPVRKWAQDMNRYYSKKNYRWPIST